MSIFYFVLQCNQYTECFKLFLSLLFLRSNYALYKQRVTSVLLKKLLQNMKQQEVIKFLFN